MTAGLAKDMMTGLQYIQNPQNLEKMEKGLPVIFIAGSDDPVGSYGKVVEQAAEKFKAAGMQNVAVRLYPMGRHEMLNELNREEVYANLLDWLKKQGFYA
jgi:alpha-beta hydrolase superfamily lysophospholipase